MKNDQNRTILYGLNTCHDIFEKLKYETKLLDDDPSLFNWFNFSLTAWHLYRDWLPKDPKRPALFKDKKQHTPQRMIDTINVLRDLAIGNKHLTFWNGPWTNKKVTDAHPPDIRSLWSFITNKPQIGIWLDQTYYTMQEIKGLALSYFEWLFDDSVPHTQFPKKITKLLNDIHNRKPA